EPANDQVLEHLLDGVDGDVFRPAEDAVAGDVAEHVDAAKFLVEFGEQCPDLFGLRHVGGNRYRAPAELPDALGRVLHTRGNAVGNVQNVGNMLIMPVWARQKPSSTSAGDGASALSAHPAAASSAAAATCPRRSPVRSELAPNSVMPTTAHKCGNALRIPMSS